MNNENDYWNYALEVFRHLGSPLRPEPAEISFMQQLVETRVADFPRGHQSRALVLGVTSEIVGMNWPDAVEVTAVDESDSMIGEFWPGDVAGERRLIKGNWFDFPSPPHAFEFILGDGVFNIPQYPEGYTSLARRMAGLLKPGGVMIIRLFTQLDDRENPEDIIEEIKQRDHFDYWSMRYRFICSLQASVQKGIFAGTYPTNRELERRGVTADAFIKKTQHKEIPVPDLPPEGLEGLLINFPTKSQFIEAVEGHFDVVSIGYGKHLMADRCPIYCLAAKTAADGLNR